MSISETYSNLSSVSLLQIEDLLSKQDFKTANELTYIYLLNLRKPSLGKRSWLYFTDIKILPSDQLLCLDSLWNKYSDKRFGFSIQRKIWLKNSKNWNLFFKNIGWKNNNKLCRYPDEFIWNLNAPIGHLPLINQIRGTQILKMLFEHEAFS
nr:hypothetical protein [Galdieria sp.]